ncbi:MAG: hypothetical protein F7B60_07895 [Desulfurococcales archaeon]|nr:hypothetical protein [Desulfurococcales archaeon]
MQTKKKVLTLRELAKKHSRLILNLLHTVTSCNHTEILPGKLYGQYGGPYIDIYNISTSLWVRVKEILDAKINPYSAGLYIATIKKREVTPSLDLAKRIARKCNLGNYRYARVSLKGEQVFLYGRDIFGENIIESAKGEGPLIILSREGEPLGWGYLKLADRKELLIENIKDVGWYVRSGG